MTPDAELLRKYAGAKSEEAFTELVRRHVDLVHSAALRQVNGDAHLAQDIAQKVFTELAREAAVLSKRRNLSGWLYTATHFIAAKAVRGERRRHFHEQKAHDMTDPTHSPTPDFDWEKLRPVLDEAMHQLAAVERDAILMRYFEKRALAEIGEHLGLSEEAARKRVERALLKLRSLLSKRGVTAAAELAATLSAHAVQAAPAELSVQLSAAALAGTTMIPGTAATAAKGIAMTTLHQTFIAAALAVAAGTGIYRAAEIPRLRRQNEALRQQQAAVTEQIRGLQSERDEAERQLAEWRLPGGQLAPNQIPAELAKLRGEVAHLRVQLAQAEGVARMTNDPFTQSSMAWSARASELKRLLEQMPEKSIPELHFLSASDWLNATQNASFDTDAGIRKALRDLRRIAKSRMPLGGALFSFAHANGGRLPDDLSQLKPYMKTPVSGGSDANWSGVDPARDDAVLDAILDRYRLAYAGNVSDLPPGAWVVLEKSPVDDEYDTQAKFGEGVSTVVNIVTDVPGAAN